MNIWPARLTSWLRRWGAASARNRRRTAAVGPSRQLGRVILWAAALVSALVVGMPLLLVGLGQAPTTPPLPARPAPDLSIMVYQAEADTVDELPLEQYVVGVVAAEMPAALAEEALRAQAVVARTYALRRMRRFGGRGCDGHPPADVCADPATGQAYVEIDGLRDRWGAQRYDYYRQRVENAVTDTAGEILVYADEPIDAVYHSTSGGHTESAAAVWGQDVPYLQGVPSPYEEQSPRLLQEVTMTLAEFATRLDVPAAEIRRRLTAGEPIIEVPEIGISGRPVTVTVAGALMPAVDFRGRLNLPSTWFTDQWHDGRVTLQVRGFGHGVGMSQYGADGMARQGADYVAILSHYYPGASLRQMTVE